MLAIHHSNAGFHPRWVAYCEEQGIPFKRVDCHASDIIQQLSDCNGLLWHHSQMNPRDLLVAKAILSALEHAGFRVFPDWRTGNAKMTPLSYDPEIFSAELVETAFSLTETLGGQSVSMDFVLTGGGGDQADRV